MKRFSLMFLIVTMVVMLLTGCNSKQPNTTPSGNSAQVETSKKPYVAIISMGFQHQFWQAVKRGAEEAAKKYNVDITFEGPESETMVDKQVEMLQAAMTKNPSAICIAAIDSKAVMPVLEQAKAANIPIIGFDAGVEGDIALTTCATDNVAASALAADKMAELINGEGQVGLIIHSQTAIDGAARRDGFVNRIKEKYPNIKIVDIQYGDGDQLKSTEIAKSMIQAYPNLKGIYGSNEGSAIGAINGVNEMDKKGKIITVGFDSGKLIKDAIRNGSMAGAITQDPISIGYKSVEAAVKAINGESLPKKIDTGCYWYDKTNIDSDKIKPLLYD